MLNRRSMAVLSGVMAIPLGSLAVANSGITAWSDTALIDAAKIRAANGLPASDAIPHAVFEYRNLKVVRSGEIAPIVCGEVKEQNDDTWSQFDLSVAKDETNLEPHPALNEATALWFSTQCRAAVRRLQGNQRGSLDEQRTCHVSAQLAEAQLERVRFQLLHELDCGEPWNEAAPAAQQGTRK